MRAAAELAALMAVLVATACNAGVRSPGARQADLRIAGSDTMLHLNRSLAAAYMASHPRVAVEVAGGGTAAGVAALVRGEVELAAASRPFTPDEVAAVYRVFDTIGFEFLVARDAVAVIVHPDNQVRDLSLGQLRDLLSGAVTNWRSLGGPDLAVVPVVRPPVSGTRRLVRDVALGVDSEAENARIALRHADVVAVVGSTPGAVGYVAAPFVDELPACRIDGVAPTVDMIHSGRYPLGRYLRFVASAPPAGAGRAFLDWCLGPVAQSIVADSGFFPLWTGPSFSEPSPSPSATADTP